MSPTADSDRQTYKRGSQNLKEKGEKRKTRNKTELKEILIGQSCSLRCQESNGIL